MFTLTMSKTMEYKNLTEESSKSSSSGKLTQNPKANKVPDRNQSISSFFALLAMASFTSTIQSEPWSGKSLLDISLNRNKNGSGKWKFPYSSTANLSNSLFASLFWERKRTLLKFIAKKKHKKKKIRSKMSKIYKIGKSHKLLVIRYRGWTHRKRNKRIIPST